MLRRKIEQILIEWKETPDHNPLVIKGCRQCGKTSSVMAFAKDHYPNVVYINFLENPSYRSIFSGSLEVSHLVMMITALLGNNAKFVAHETVLILDEIQDCPEARTALKFFKLDGQYDVIATGSLLGVCGYGKQPKSIPVGYESIIEMMPMDFEEFLWANGVTQSGIEWLRTCLNHEQPVPEALHNRCRELFLQYTVVGGMPAVVQEFVNSHDMHRIWLMQKDIIQSYPDDMIKYADATDKSKRSFTQFITVPAQGFMEEQFEVSCFVDPDLLFRMKIRSTLFMKKFLSFWVYDRLKVYYKLSGEDNDGE